jgi:glutathione S-transferase
MILIGHYDSPFVRRVAIALRLYEMPFEHRAWSVFGDADKIARFNPLIRVPTLVLDNGEILIESAAVLDAIDQEVGEDRAMIPPSGPQRRAVLKVCALGAGLADKAVSLVYEKVLHERATPVWVNRCRGQMSGVLDALETERSGGGGGWWFGDTLTHADIMIACALRFVSEAHSEAFGLARWPALAAHSAACEAMAAFQEIQQPFFISAPTKA